MQSKVRDYVTPTVWNSIKFANEFTVSVGENDRIRNRGLFPETFFEVHPNIVREEQEEFRKEINSYNDHSNDSPS